MVEYSASQEVKSIVTGMKAYPCAPGLNIRQLKNFVIINENWYKVVLKVLDEKVTYYVYGNKELPMSVGGIFDVLSFFFSEVKLYQILRKD